MTLILIETYSQMNEISVVSKSAGFVSSMDIADTKLACGENSQPSRVQDSISSSILSSTQDLASSSREVSKVEPILTEQIPTTGLVDFMAWMLVEEQENLATFMSGISIPAMVGLQDTLRQFLLSDVLLGAEPSQENIEICSIVEHCR